MVSLEPEEYGAIPRLRPGDVVRIGTDIAVITDASVAGTSWLYLIAGAPRAQSVPTYSAAWGRIGTGRKWAWYQIQEFDEVLSLGPFHEYFDSDVAEEV